MKLCLSFSRVIIAVSLTGMIALSAMSQTILDRLEHLQYMPDRVIVKLKDGTPQTEAASMLQSMNARSVQRFQRIGAEVWTLSGISVADAIRIYHNDPRIEYIEPDLLHQLVRPVEIQSGGFNALNDGLIPDDHFFPLQWALRNTGQGPFLGTAGADIDATRAWTLTTGTDVLIAIVDTGIDYLHEDLADNIWEGIGYDFVDDDNDPMDLNGHGTHVAGTVAAVGNNGIGVAGVNWSAKLMAVKVLDDDGWGSTSSIIAGIEYTIEQGVKISNHSWGGSEFQQSIYDAFEAARNAGQLAIAAAGNWEEDTDLYPFYPANFDLDNIIAVASSDYNDMLSDFSNYGRNSVHLAAPGHMIGSTYPDNIYAYMWGTSMAAPHVTGTAGLISSLEPELDYSELQERILRSVDPVPSLGNKTITGGRLNAYFAVTGPDDIPPAIVQDLEVHAIGSNSVTLQWTAVGHDEFEGTATAYDIRYTTEGPITEFTFNDATQIVDPPIPKESGSTETFIITNLDFNTTYYFALTVSDRWGNVSEVSNSVQATTLGIPHVVVSPVSLSESLLAGATSEQIITITNNGEGNLGFWFPDFGGRPPQAMGFQKVEGIQSASHDPVVPVLPAKGTMDTRMGTPVIVGQGGPDEFGYRWIDSNEPDGPVFQWFDISTIGSEVHLGDDEYINVELPFLFPFYGGAKSSVYISANGFLTFHQNGAWEYRNMPIPTTDYPNDLIAPFWTDLYPPGEGSIYYFIDDEIGQFIVQYQNVPHIYYEGSYTFQVILHENGKILFQYLSMDGPRNIATVGVENAEGTDGLEVAFNTPYIEDGLAVSILAGHPWLDVEPDNGIVASGNSIDVTVTFNATDLFGGEYSEDLQIYTNDPENPLVIVPVSLNVAGIPAMSISPSVLDFGVVFISTEVEKNITVRNSGTDVLEVYSLEIDNGVFSIVNEGFALDPLESRSIGVNFSPVNVGDFIGTLTITSNDPNDAVVTIEILGSAVNPPVISVTPSMIDDHLLSGESSEHTLTLKNTGESDLEFMISVENFLNTNIASNLQKPYSFTRDHGRNNNNITQQKGIQDFRRGIPVLQGAGGPDIYGYRGIDSNEQGGPVFQWVDIAQAGTRLFLGDDDYARVDMPFLFPFYDEFKSVAYISSNGFITFEGEYASEIPWSTIPDVYPPNDFIMPFGTDLNPSARGAVYYYNDAQNGRFIVQYQDVPHYPAEGSFTFQVILYKNGSIVFQYLTMDGMLDYAIIGIENSDGTDGLQVSYHSPYVENELAVRISTMPQWLSVSPASGVVSAGEELTITVSLNADSLYGGEYNAHIIIQSNDPVTPQVNIPVQLSVTGIPLVSVSESSIDFGNVFVGGVQIKHLVVYNTGTDDLFVDEVTSDSGQFEIAEAEFALSPREGRIIPISFRPDSTRAFTGTLTISSNAQNEAKFAVMLTGVGMPPPVLAVNEDTLVVALTGGQQSNELLQLWNLGLSDLTFEVRARPPGGILPSPGGRLRVAMIHEHCVNISNMKFLLSVYTDFETVDAMDIFENTPSLDTLLTYHAVLVSNDCPFANPVLLGNLLADFVDSGGSVVLTGFGFVEPLDIKGRFQQEGYMPFQIDDYDVGYGELYDHNLTHPVMQGVDYAFGAYIAEDLKIAPGAELIAEWTNGSLFVAAKGAVVGVNVFIGEWSWGGDIPRLLRNALVYAYKKSGPSWLSVNPESGVIPPQNSFYINLLFNAIDVIDGEYRADFVIYSNDPLRSTVVIPGKFLLVVPVEIIAGNLPDKFELYQNYPNPFNPSTTIRYDLPVTSKVVIQIYNVLGEKVVTLVNEEQQAGYHSVMWGGINDYGFTVGSGVYIYTITAGEFRQANRMVFVK
jgi:subtilisin family serine protease